MSFHLSKLSWKCKNVCMIWTNYTECRPHQSARVLDTQAISILGRASVRRGTCMYIYTLQRQEIFLLSAICLLLLFVLRICICTMIKKNISVATFQTAWSPRYMYSFISVVREHFDLLPQKIGTSLSNGRYTRKKNCAKGGGSWMKLRVSNNLLQRQDIKKEELSWMEDEDQVCIHCRR